MRGFAYDEVNAAMAAGWSNLPELEARLVRLQSLRPTPDFEPLGRQLQAHPQHPRPGEVYRRRHRRTRACWSPVPRRDFTMNTAASPGQPIETVISRLRPKVDLFFDKVLVNAPDPPSGRTAWRYCKRCWRSFHDCRFF